MVTKSLITTLGNEPSKTHNPEFHTAWNHWNEKTQHKSWLKSHILTRGYDMISILDSKKLSKLSEFYSDKNEGIQELTRIIIDKPYTSPKAELLKFLSKISAKERSALNGFDGCKTAIFASAQDSVLITCSVPLSYGLD
jgi:hypothetical protein